MTNADEISPLLIFISSSQKEFGKLRKEIQRTIDDETLGSLHSRLMKAVLIEQERGEVISKDILENIEKSSIYVGIFGKKYSEWTVAEYREARRRSLPLLIYHLKKRKRGRPSGRKLGGRKSKVEKFLENEVMKFEIRVRELYWNESELITNILKDLAYVIAELVREETSIRKIIHKRLPLQ